ncbi:Rab GTPase-TBC domain protein [Metarhizium robertsii]|uniref:GTPase activating protein n=2 Tax=Metarhizium robertsii TaxID=568076 RepID=E9EXM4_METRA|nr:GTPase activating protein [Metarhizium robertsii ARSEF 23]EFY99844.1 GTPase activating protein [Metarhizium robertsii ARSEF 23]EXV06535.1 Rab GTPase-TBC domain protein [Metarhizium robertsii]
MLPTRFASVRHKNRPSTGRASFRDDTNVVGFRYEKTKPAEPPVPLPPPRNPLRSPSSVSIARSNRTTATNISRSTSSSSVITSCSASPVVVAPPALAFMPFVAPPTEQHPALRSPLPANAYALGNQDGKRDSGHAGTTASDSVIHEEDCEDDSGRDETGQKQEEQRPCSDKTRELGRDGAVPEAAKHIESRPEGRALVVEVQTDRASAAGAALPGSPASTAANSPSLPQADKSSRVFKQPISPRKLIKKRSLRHSGHKGRRSSESSERAKEEPPMETEPEPLVRGSMATPASPMHKPGQNRDASLQSVLIPPGGLDGASNGISSATPDLDAEFAPLAISIPTDNFLDDAFMTGFSFSKRGSLMFGGKRAAAVDNGSGAMDLSPSTTAPADNHNSNHAEMAPSSIDQTMSGDTSNERNSSSFSTAMAQPVPDIRILSPDVEKESQKVRSLYQTDDAINWEDGARFSFCEHLEPTPEVPAEEDSHDPDLVPIANLGLASAGPRSVSSFSHYPDNTRRETELAGGLEDWEDIDGADVDRYGFIAPKRPSSRVGTPTELKSAQFSPRRRNVLLKRDSIGLSSSFGGRTPSRKVSARSLNTVHSGASVTSLRSLRSSRSVMRQASNLLPQNRNRRWMDEAGDMLTVSPTLQDRAEEAQVEKISEGLKRKEWERSEKWRKMARVVKQGPDGQGMEFEFDVKNSKLIERTWKGIPDRWRGAAWWSFLAAAAKEHNAPSSEFIINSFHNLQQRSSPDDVQIDLDVPRTINMHIMFRRRYRGGQRLLFRVLHALSIYFPETGYVQGMASLAATLLCYFDEEKCFVMLVRMWSLRGLDRLYRPGFEGLMTALREFDGTWLAKPVAEKLTELDIDSTAYGTRWYLTLFNLSIPFGAQLRVWDVFLLLGDGVEESSPSSSARSTATPRSTMEKNSEAPALALASGLDILHATSAALIQALREVLLDSDFENAMKALTSWIPIKDEDLLMKVAKAEWKTHQGKKKT